MFVSVKLPLESRFPFRYFAVTLDRFFKNFLSERFVEHFWFHIFGQDSYGTSAMTFGQRKRKRGLGAIDGPERNVDNDRTVDTREKKNKQTKEMRLPVLVGVRTRGAFTRSHLIARNIGTFSGVNAWSGMSLSARKPAAAAATAASAAAIVDSAIFSFRHFVSTILFFSLALSVLAKNKIPSDVSMKNSSCLAFFLCFVVFFLWGGGGVLFLRTMIRE